MQNGCKAFTTPAPWVQREPAPAASVTTATSPLASAARPRFTQAIRQGSRGRGVGKIAFADVLDDGIGGQAVLGEADAPGLEILADLLVHHAVEAVFGQQARERVAGACVLVATRENGVEQRVHHALQLRPGAAGGGELVELGKARRAEFPALHAEQGRNDETIVAGGHQRVTAS